MSVVGPAVAAGIGAAGALAGGAIGRSADEDAFRNQRRWQKKILTRSLQWKVEDAKKAGIHPLYALGHATPSATSFIPGQSPMGDAVKEAASHLATGVRAATDPVTRAQVDLLNKQGSLIDEQILASQQARAAQGAIPTPAVSYPAGTPQNPVPAEISVRGRDGKIYWVPNPDIGSDFGEMMAPQVYRMLANPNEAPKLMDKINQIADRVRADNPAMKYGDALRRAFIKFRNRKRDRSGYYSGR